MAAVLHFNSRRRGICFFSTVLLHCNSRRRGFCFFSTVLLHCNSRRRGICFFSTVLLHCNSRRRGFCFFSTVLLHSATHDVADFGFFLPLPHCNSRFRDVVSCSKRGGRRELNTHTYKVHLPRASSFELLYLRCAARTEAHRSASPRQVGASTTAIDHTTRYGGS